MTFFEKSQHFKALISRPLIFLNFETSSIRFSDVIYPDFDPKINFVPLWRPILLLFEQISRPPHLISIPRWQGLSRGRYVRISCSKGLYSAFDQGLRIQCTRGLLNIETACFWRPNKSTSRGRQSWWNLRAKICYCCPKGLVFRHHGSHPVAPPAPLC